MEKKVIYGFRKSKLTKGLCGAVLGASLFAAGQTVAADELAAGQDSVLAVSSEQAASASESSSNLPLHVPSQELDQAAAAAREAGAVLEQPVVVEREISSPDQANQAAAEVLADYKDQAQQIDQTVREYQAQLADHETRLAAIKEANQAKADQYAQEQAVYEAELARVTAENARLKAEQEAKEQDYQAALAKVMAARAQNEAVYQQEQALYQEKMAAIQAANAELQARYEEEQILYEQEVRRIRFENERSQQDYQESLAAARSKNAASEAVNQENQKKNAAAREAYDKALSLYQEELAAVTKANADNEAAYRLALQTYQEDLARIQADNAAKKAAYETALQAYQQEKEGIRLANESSKQAYQEKLAAIQQQNAELNQENDSIRRQNAAAQAQYEADLARYQADSERITAQNQANQALYQRQLEVYQADLARIQAENTAKQAQYDAAQTRYQEELARIQSQNQQAKAVYEAKLAEIEIENTAIEAANQLIRQQNQAAQATYESQQAQYEADLASVTKTNADKEAAYQTALIQYQAETARIQAENESKRSNYQTALAQYQIDLDRIQEENRIQRNLYETRLEETKAWNEGLKTQNAAIRAENEKLQAAYEQELAAYTQAKTAYDAAKARYDRDFATYEKALQDAEANKDQEGYLSKVESQPFVFKSEPQAILNLDPAIQTYTNDELTDLVKSWGMDNSGMTALTNVLRGKEHQTKVILQKDVPLVATYTNIQNSSIQGKKIAKVVYTYTLKESSKSQDRLPIMLVKDPTLTVWTLDFYGHSRVNLQAEFFDEQDQKLDMTGSLVSFSSLNTNSSAIEYIKHFNGEYIPITGSAIAIHPDTSVHADISINFEREGSRFEHSKWDSPNSPLNWYGAIVGKAQGDVISFDIGSRNRGSAWFVFNSDIKAKGVPVTPTAPQEVTEPSQPAYQDEIALTDLPEEPAYQSLPEAPSQPNYENLPAEPVKDSDLPLPSAPQEPVYGQEQTLKDLPQVPSYQTEPEAPVAPLYEAVPQTPVQPENQPLPSAPVQPVYESEKELHSLPLEPTEQAEPDQPEVPVYEPVPTEPAQAEVLPLPKAPQPPSYTPARNLDPLPVEPPMQEEPQAPQLPSYLEPAQAPVQPAEIPLPSQPAPVSLLALPTAPQAPLYQELTQEPAAPRIQYRYIQLSMKLQVQEGIKNAAEANIHSQTVAKDSLVQFEWKTSSLPAHRTETTAFVLTSQLPEGFELELTATQAASPGFEVSYDPASRVLTFVASPATLTQFNANLNQESPLLYPTAVGRLREAGRSYRNQFSLTVNDRYRVESNAVTVSTPAAEAENSTQTSWSSGQTYLSSSGTSATLLPIQPTASTAGQAVPLAVSYHQDSRQLPRTGSANQSAALYLGSFALLAALGLIQLKKEADS